MRVTVISDSVFENTVRTCNKRKHARRDHNQTVTLTADLALSSVSLQMWLQYAYGQRSVPSTHQSLHLVASADERRSSSERRRVRSAG